MEFSEIVFVTKKPIGENMGIFHYYPFVPAIGGVYSSEFCLLSERSWYIQGEILGAMVGKC